MNGHPSSQVLRGCSFQLDVFRWESRDDAEQLLEFLPSQPSLRVLAVEWIVDPKLNTLGICPGLQVLHGNQGLLEAFLPERRIISLKWLPNVQELRSGLISSRFPSSTISLIWRVPRSGPAQCCSFSPSSARSP